MTTENGFDHQEDIQDTHEPPKKIMKIDEPEKIEKKPLKVKLRIKRMIKVTIHQYFLW